MRLLIVAATGKEIEPFVNSFPAADILITGVGVPATIYSLQKKIHQYQFDHIIQAGIAGCFVGDFLPGQVVFVNQDRFADLGMEEEGRFSTIFEMGFGSENESPFNKGWLLNNDPYLLKSSLPKVKALTVNKVTDDPAQTRQLINKFDPQVETMEGAAFHYVCLQEKIPFLQIRGISNYVGERDRKKWKIPEAIERLNVELGILVDQLMS